MTNIYEIGPINRSVLVKHLHNKSNTSFQLLSTFVQIYVAHVLVSQTILSVSLDLPRTRTSIAVKLIQQ